VSESSRVFKLTLYLDKANVDGEDCGLNDFTVNSLNWYSSDVSS
jgi:hypothetical protein